MKTPAAVLPQVNSAVTQELARHRDAFLHAQPYKHTTIEDFFEPGFAQRLLTEFPSFDPKLSINEAGTEGGKAVTPPTPPPAAS